MSGYPRTPERIFPGDDPVRTAEAWPQDWKASPREDIPLLDVDSNAAWWFAGALLAACILLVMALLDADAAIRWRDVQINNLQTQILQHKVEQEAWVCSRLERKRGALVKWCIQSQGF